MTAIHVHVMPSEVGEWTVLDEHSGVLSSHPSETEAERAAHAYASRCGAREIMLHDRYGRVHRLLNGDRKQPHRPY